MYFPNTTWTRLFLAVAFIQALLALGIEDYVFATVEGGLDPAAYQIASGHTVPMYFSLFIFAYVYELVMVYDALRLNSMIQLVGLCIYNFLLLLYTAVQPQHVKKALILLTESLVMGVKPILPPEYHTWERISVALIAVIVVQVVATAALAFLTYKLHFEFAWVVYKVIHADLYMKRRLLNFEVSPSGPLPLLSFLLRTLQNLARDILTWWHSLQIYMALIKFDFFFLLGFLVQIVTIMANHKDPEFGLTIAGIFVAFAVMCLAIYCAMQENKPGSIAIIAAYTGAAAYLSYKLSVLYNAIRYNSIDFNSDLYNTTNYLLIAFAAITLAMMICTIVMAIVCMANFDKGLRTYTMRQQKAPDEDIHLHHAQNYSYRPSSRLDLAD
ncbi:hypothetical protein PG994_006810 [Apiospora phragmitis]|uniref:Uncharacterized protein n=1 Tax=Apiospora phragmitis TaxID=2905665 RepID=A0ABR1VG47_9PEZI